MPLHNKKLINRLLKYYFGWIVKFKKRFTKSNKKNKLLVLMNNLEKIGKISALRLEKDYTDPVIRDLIWIQESFIKVLKLKHTNPELFHSLIDPHNRFQKRTFNQEEFEHFAFSIIDELPPPEENGIDKYYKKVYPTFENPANTDNLIYRYIQTIFSIWNAANIKENFVIQKYCIYVFTNWIAIIDVLDDPKFDYQYILRLFLENLTALNLGTLQLKDGQLHPMFRLLAYNIYLNQIFNNKKDKENHKNVDLYFEYLFTNLFHALRYDKYAIGDAFIESCIDGNYNPSNYGHYSSLYSLVAKRLQGMEYPQLQDLLKPIPSLGFYDIRYIKSFDELKAWTQEFDQFLESKLRDKIVFDEEINQQITLIKKLAFDVLRYNKLQITVLKMLAYALYKSNSSLIQHAFEYNQPSDSNAIQGNKEIVPTTLPEILNYMSYRNKIEYELLSYWSGHNGVEYYLDQLFLILLYRYNAKKLYGTEDVKNIVSVFCKENLNDDPGSVEGFNQYITRLKSVFDYLLNQEQIKNSFFKSAERIEKTKGLLNNISESIVSSLDKIGETGNLKPETKTNFIAAVVKEYYEHNFLLQVFKRYGHANLDVDQKFDNIGINELLDRTAFVENWHIPYIGLIENRGKDLAEQENRIAQFKFIANIPSQNNLKINEQDIPTAIQKHKGTNKIIIARNIYFDSILRMADDYKPYWKDKGEISIIPHFYVGTISDMPIFNLYDKLFQKSFLVIDPYEIKFAEKVDEAKPPFTNIEYFRTSFIDFANDDEQLQKFVHQPPYWLKEQFGVDTDALTKFLKKKVWIRISKQTLFSVPAQSQTFLYEIE